MHAHNVVMRDFSMLYGELDLELLSYVYSCACIILMYV